METRESLMEMVRELQSALGTQNEVVLFPGDEQATLERAMANFFLPGERAVFAVMGEDGDCWANIGEAYGLQVIRLGSEWGEVITAEDIALLLQSMKKEEVHGVFVTFHETSTGVLVDIEPIARQCRERGILYVVSAFRSVGALDLAMDSWGVDVLVSVIPEGVGIFSASKRAWDYGQKKRRQGGFRSLLGIQENSLLPPLLESARGQLQKERAVEYQKITRMVREGIQAMGLTLLVKREEIASKIFTTVVLPGEADVEQVLGQLSNQGISGVRGLKRKTSQIIRIDHRECDHGEKASALLLALGQALSSQGISLKMREGINRVREVYYHE